MSPLFARTLQYGLMALAILLTASPGQAETSPLLDTSVPGGGVRLAGAGGGEGNVIEVDGSHVIALTYGHRNGDYPGLEIKPAEGLWDLSDSTAVRFSITNTGDARTRVHGRVDNPGDWRESPWSVNAMHLNPGESGTLTVPFGRHYGNPAFELDPARVRQLMVFGEHPRQATTLHITAIEAVTGTTSAPPRQAATSTSGDAAAMPASHTLYDFQNDFDPGRLSADGARYEVVDDEGGKALRVTFEPGAQYPGVQLNAPGSGWDLHNRAGIEVDLNNPGQRGITVALRADNPGSWQDEPWNAEKAHLPPGETKTIRVRFGQSWGAPGFSLNPARVVRALVYAERPQTDAVVLISELRSWGHAAAREVDTVDLEGVLLDFNADFVPAGRVEEQGATARLDGDRLVIRYGTGEQWPAVALRPVARQWDLSNFESVQTQVTNLGDASVRIGLRVDNPGAPDASNTEIVPIPPGQTRTLKVTFGMSWGSQAYALDPSKVTSLLVFVDKPGQPGSIAIGQVKANRRQFAEVPAWVGQRPPVEGDWVQTLDENFDSPVLNTAIWTPRLVWDGPAAGETQRYLEENVYIEDGRLIIRCEIDPGHQYNDPSLDTREYATGAVTTLDKWTQRYGYFEARLKRPSARGLWPAFWMMPDRGEGAGDIWVRRSTENGGMEIDIWEHLTEWGPNRYNIATHWDGYGANHKHWGRSDIYHLPTQDGFHHFGLLWEPGKLTWFADGRKVGEWEDEKVTDVPQYLKFTVQMGNWATKNVDRAALPDHFEIDYVRAWQRRDRITD